MTRETDSFLFSPLPSGLSLQECEALCTRLAIMVNGRFQCIGSLQHLKSRFGRGISLVVKLNAERTAELKSFVDEHFPENRVKDQHAGIVSFELTGDYKWAEIFGRLEEARSLLHFEDYSVSQVTLEQVFLEFTKHQAEDDRV